MVPFGGSLAFFVRRMPRRPRARVPVALKISLRSADRSCVSIFIWLSFPVFVVAMTKGRFRPLGASMGLWSHIPRGALASVSVVNAGYRRPIQKTKNWKSKIVKNIKLVSVGLGLRVFFAPLLFSMPPAERRAVN